MSSRSRPQYCYGLSVQLFAFPKPQGDAVVIGGLSAGRLRWTRVLSQRAAGMLWVSLAQLLDPQHAQAYLSRLTTLGMREPAMPTITTSVVVDVSDAGEYEICGTSGQQTWSAVFGETEARAFWLALSQALRAQMARRVSQSR